MLNGQNPHRNENSDLTLFRILLASTLLLTLAGLYEFASPLRKTGALFDIFKGLIPFGLGALTIIVELALLAGTWSTITSRFMDALTRWLGRLRVWNLVIFALAIVVTIFLMVGPFSQYLPGLLTRFCLFWLTTLVGCVLLKAWYLHPVVGQTAIENKGWLVSLATSLLLVTFGFRVGSFLPDISTYPFTLSWSEASRYYYASLFFSRNIYGISVPPTVLHPSRYLLLAIPFLIPNLPLWFLRAWQVFLWLVMPLLTAFWLVRRLSIEKLTRWLLILWIFLYLLLGPVYYHLLVPVWIILWGFKPASKSRGGFLQSLAAVLLASAWAGISRINWFPVPGMLAAALYFLEKPLGTIALRLRSSGEGQTTGRQLWRLVLYLIQPVAWFFLGTAIAFASQALYIFWSGNAASQFSTSLSSDLLWYRLLPSPTYLPGILPAILIVSLPLFLFIWSRLTRRQNTGTTWQSYHLLRLLGLAAILLVLFGGGLVVSVKIGGGSNLHNMDAYLVVLLVIAATVYFNQFIPDQILTGPVSATLQNGIAYPSRLQRIALALSLATWAFFTVISRGPTEPLPDQKQIDKSLALITRRAEEASQSGGEVLFISNRHLLTFHYITGVPLVPDYERVFLMEMAMAGDPQYLGKFHDELKNHRFALIVNEPLYTRQKGAEETFGEENDAWVNQVSKYILCYYQEDRLARAIRVQLFVPNPDAKDCELAPTP